MVAPDLQAGNSTDADRIEEVRTPPREVVLTLDEVHRSGGSNEHRTSDNSVGLA